MALRLFQNPRDLEEMRRTHGSFLGWKRMKACSVIYWYVCTCTHPHTSLHLIYESFFRWVMLGRQLSRRKSRKYGSFLKCASSILITLWLHVIIRQRGKYYHPSNAKFWFYGDDPADARLELVDKYLSEFEKIEVRF